MSTRRRDFLGAPLAAGLSAAIPPISRAAGSGVIEEHDPANTNLCRHLKADITDDDLLFLKQIGLRWARVNFAPERADFDYVRKTQQRFERFGIKRSRFRIDRAAAPNAAGAKRSAGFGRDRNGERVRKDASVSSSGDRD